MLNESSHVDLNIPATIQSSIASVHDISVLTGLTSKNKQELSQIKLELATQVKKDRIKIAKQRKKMEEKEIRQHQEKRMLIKAQEIKAK